MLKLKGALIFAITMLLISACSNKSEITPPLLIQTSIETDSTVIWMGKTYHKVKIGSQIWLKENLDVGKMIPSTVNQSNNGIIEKYYYNNDSVHYAYLGAFYQWNEAMNYGLTPGERGISPQGYHIPTSTDIDVLLAFVGNNTNALKALGEGAGDGAGNNSSGYTLYLTGGFYGGQGFSGLGQAAHYWTSSGYDAQSALEFSVWAFDSFPIWGDSLRNDKIKGAFSIRCIKDNR